MPIRLATGRGRTQIHRLAEAQVSAIWSQLRTIFRALNASDVARQPDHAIQGWVDFKRDLYALFQSAPVVALINTTVAATRPVIVARRRGATISPAGEVPRVVLPAAERWIAIYAGERVEGITLTTQKALRDLLEEGYRQGMTIPQIAREMQDIPFLGVTKRQAAQLLRRRSALLAQGLSEDRVRRTLTKAADKALRDRSLLIAKHESLKIGNISQNLAWQEMTRDGQLNPKTARRAWVTTPTACAEICAPMEGVQVGLTEAWSTSVGSVTVPQDSHVNCNCTEMLTGGM